MIDARPMTPAEVRLWRTGWQPEHLVAVNRRLGRWFRQEPPRRRPPDLSGLEVTLHEGRVDLRGLTLDCPLASSDVLGMDFSGLRLVGMGQLGPFSRFENCRFDRADLRTNVREDFESCSFDRAILRRAVFGKCYAGCSFRATDLRTSLANETLFRECDFGAADLRSVQWTSCRFEACRFSDCKFGKGTLAGAVFVDCDIRPQTLNDADVLLERIHFE